MNNEYWDTSGNASPFEKNKLVEMLTKSGAELDVAHEVANQLSLIDEENNNVIFIFTDDNQMVVTGIHVPAESLNGETGPVLMRGGNDKSIIAAFSRDFIVEKLEKVELMEEGAGLHRAGDAEWITELENLAELVRIEMKANPPESWDDLLAGGN
jgi:hypothetical protein